MNWLQKLFSYKQPKQKIQISGFDLSNVKVHAEILPIQGPEHVGDDA